MIRILLIIFLYSSYAFSQNDELIEATQDSRVLKTENITRLPKLEIVVDKSNLIKKINNNDTEFPEYRYQGFDYQWGESFYIIPGYVKKKYDTIVVFFDNTMKDTMILCMYNGYTNIFYKEWFKDGKIKTLINSKSNTNKSWYDNGQLRWDKVVYVGLLSILDYDINIKNKTWYKDGTLRSEILNFNDTILKIVYNSNGKLNNKTYYFISPNILKGNGYSTPESYYFCQYFRSEYYCENGQLFYTNFFMSEIDNWKTYDCNGNLRFYCDHYNTLGYWGKFQEFYENGKVKVDGQYTNYDKLIKSVVPYQIGVWKYYDKDGKIEKTEEYDDNGKLKSK